MLLATAQADEHYETSLYGTLKAWAERLDMLQAVTLLDQTLTEEKNTDKSLTELAEAAINCSRNVLPRPTRNSPTLKPEMNSSSSGVKSRNTAWYERNGQASHGTLRSGDGSGMIKALVREVSVPV
jgi:Domain of unknown function (DUF892)